MSEVLPGGTSPRPQPSHRRRDSRAKIDWWGWGEASLSCSDVVLRARLLDRPGGLLRVLRPPNVLPNAPAPSARAGLGSYELLHRRPVLGPHGGSPRRVPPEPPLRRDRSRLAHRPFGSTPAAVLVGERVDRSGHRRWRTWHRPPSGGLARRDGLLSAHSAVARTGHEHGGLTPPGRCSAVRLVVALGQTIERPDHHFQERGLLGPEHPEDVCGVISAGLPTARPQFRSSRVQLVRNPVDEVVRIKGQASTLPLRGRSVGHPQVSDGREVLGDGVGAVQRFGDEHGTRVAGLGQRLGHLA